MDHEAKTEVQGEVIEEYWPSMASSGALSGFAQHQLVRVNLLPHGASFVEVECVPSLSPLDMVNLSCGTHDSTGHTVWTGAFFLIEALAAPVDNNSLLSEYFQSKRVLELGSGSGVSGLALLLAPCAWKARPSHITFSDNDADVLALCRRNCERNLSSNPAEYYDYAVTSLPWGEVLKTKTTEGIEKLKGQSTSTEIHFETVLATDVIYDMGCLDALLFTASQSMGSAGHFILSHIPRACLSDYRKEHDNDYHSALETLIVDTAIHYGFALERMIRPCDIICHDDKDQARRLNSRSFGEMEESGAAILIFEKQPASGENH